MNVLVVNAGSSSLKYKLIDMDNEQVLAGGICERINVDGEVSHSTYDGRKFEKKTILSSHTDAFKIVADLLTSSEFGVLNSLNEISAIGHRVVQGAEKFNKSVVVSDSVLEEIENLSDLAPLHNPAHVEAIKACKSALGEDVFQVVVFDTAFHQTIPPHAYIYGLPYNFYTDHNVRKYGFHGTSHRYVSLKVAQLVGKPLSCLKIVSCHLGNGSSVCAIKNGESIDNSMGLTPLDGILMGTRCGTVDPSVITFLMEKENFTAHQMADIMNHKSGLLGISGISSDFRDVKQAAQEGNERAQLAIKMLAYHVRRQICAAFGELDGADILLFTGGIGENADLIRRLICSKLNFLGIELNEIENSRKTRGVEGLISVAGCKVKVFVISTNEELMIARDTLELLNKLK